MNIRFYALVVQRVYKYANNKLHTKYPHITLHNGNGSVMSNKNAAEAFNTYFGSIYTKDNGISYHHLQGVR